MGSSHGVTRTTTRCKMNEFSEIVAGGNGEGHQLNQLNNPNGIYVDDENKTIYIADTQNHRVLEWKSGEREGRIVAGGNGPGNGNDQLNSPFDVVLDKETNSLIISDQENRRVVLWSRQNPTNGRTIIENVGCSGLALDEQRFIYVSDCQMNDVKRYKMQENNGTVVAGGNRKGSRLNQLDYPTFICVDKDQCVYVSDVNNHRVVKWRTDAKTGIVVAGVGGRGIDSSQLSHPQGVCVDSQGTVYVSDCWNHRVMEWLHQAKQGNQMVGGFGRGFELNQIQGPAGLSFDKDGNLYVVDSWNHRILRFSKNEFVN